MMLADFRLALAQEFKLLATLRHPHVIEVLDYGFDEAGQPYFTMELLENAQTILEASKNFSIRQRVELIVQILQALSYLHRRGILHRDIKPANVLVVDGNVKLLDFGLSAMQDRSKSEEDAGGATVGTLSYMAPEVLIGDSSSESSDLYAVGMIGYELFMGSHPFDSTDVSELINHVLYQVPEIEDIDGNAELADIFRQLLEKSPEDRFETASDVLIGLNDVVDYQIPLETAEIRESFLKGARLIGRDAEMDRLASALDSTFKGKGSSWLLAGESGVGKSRLVDEFRTLAMVKGSLVMNGQAIGQGRSPYQMWHNVLQWLTLMSELNDEDITLVQMIVPKLTTRSRNRNQLTTQLNPQQIKLRIFERIRDMLEAQTRPIIMFFEDLHWAGDESLEMLSLIHEITDKLPLMIIASFRDDERPSLPRLLPKISVLELKRLSDESIAELSQAMLGDAGNRKPVIDLLQRETGGNVFFLIEVVRALAEEAGNLSEIGKRTLPQNVFAGGVNLVVRRRLERVSPKSMALLKIAAIWGRQQDLHVLRLLKDDVDLDKWLIECSDAVILDVQDDVWRFTHDKMRDVLIDEINAKEKKLLHRQVAEALEQLTEGHEQIPLLAYHWQMADDPIKEEHYVMLAGEQALLTGVYREAIDYFERVDSLLKKQSVNEVTKTRNIMLLHRQAEAYSGIGEYPKAQHLYWQGLLLAEQVDDKEMIARSHNGLGDVYHALSNHIDAKKQYEKGLAIYRELDDQFWISRTFNSLGNVAYDLGEDEEAKQYYQDSLNISREIGGQWSMAGSFSTQDANVVDDSQIEQQIKELERNLKQYKQENDNRKMGSTYFELSKLTYDQKKYDQASKYLQECLAIYQEEADIDHVIQVYLQLGRVQLAKSEYDLAFDQLTSALSILAQDDNGTLLSVLLETAKIRIAQKRKVDAFELLTFILYHPDVDDETEDDAERLVFEIEEQLDSQTVKSALEKGKNSKLEDVMKELLN